MVSSHALLAFSRTPNRSALVMVSPSGRSEAGPSLVRAGRIWARPLPTSEQSLISGLFFLPAECLPPRLSRPTTTGSRNTGVAVMIPCKLNFYFHMELRVVSVSRCLLMGMVDIQVFCLCSFHQGQPLIHTFPKGPTSSSVS